MTEPIPQDRTRTKHIVMVLVGSLLAFAVGLGLWAVIARPGSAPSRQVEIEPAQPTSEATQPLPPVSVAESSTQASASAGASVAPGGVVVQSGFNRAAKVAFRLGDSVYVSAEDGSGAIAIGRSADGPYSLSPDGRTLAVVDSGMLVLFDVATKARVPVGPAEGSLPVWQPDSGQVYFVRIKSAAGSVPEVWRVARDGKRSALVEPGMEAAVSPDGRVLALRPLDAGYVSATEAARLRVSVSGGPLGDVKLPGQPTAVAVGNDRVYVALVDATGKPTVMSFAHDGSGSRAVLGAPGGSAGGAVWGRLMLSPDGARIAAAALGDDGFSRITLAPAAGGTGTDITPRRDGDPHGWNARGDGFFFHEGNAFQGESTALIKVSADGSKRVVLVTGAQ